MKTGKNLIVVAALFALPLSAGAAYADPPGKVLPQDFISAEGEWELTYPDGWTVTEAREDAWTLANFEIGPQCCDLQDGDVKIDFTIEPNTEERSLSQLRSAACSATRRGIRDPLECETVSIGGRQWVQVVFEEGSDGGRALLAQSVANGRIYTAEAAIGSGPEVSATLESVKGIVRSFRLHRNGIARTGAPVTGIVALALALLLLGAASRAVSRRARPTTR